MTKAGLWLNAVLASLGIGAFVAIAAFFGYKWLAHDEANRAYACGSGSRGGTCLEGEATNMALCFLFAAIALVGIVLTIKAVRSQLRADRERFDN